LDFRGSSKLTGTKELALVNRHLKTCSIGKGSRNSREAGAKNSGITTKSNVIGIARSKGGYVRGKFSVARYGE
jgi:hypothetical protein